MQRIPCTTTMACFFLAAVSAAQQGVNFTGLHTDPLGAAQVQLDPSSGDLRISNIGSSGQDGARILHPGFMGLDIELEPAAGVSPGSHYDVRTVGSIQGASNQTLALSTAQEVGGGLVELRVRFPAAASSSKRIEFRRNGIVLSALDGVLTDQVGTIYPAMAAAPVWTDVHYDAEIIGYTPWGDPIYTFIARTTFSHDWTRIPAHDWAHVRVLATANYFDVDEIRILSDQVVGPIFPDHTDVLAQNSTDIVIQAQGPIALDDRHVLGINNSILTNDLQSGHLVVSNLGASGQDGVAIAVPHSQALTLELAGLPLASSLPLGARLGLKTECIDLGDLGLLLLTKSAGPLVANVSSPGASSFLLELYDHGALVTSASMPSGDVLRFGPWPKRVSSFADLGVMKFMLEFGAAVQLTIPGGGTFLGDEVHMLASGASAPIAHIDVAKLTGKLLGGLELASVVTASMPAPSSYCTAKVNSLGCTPAIGMQGEPSLSIDDLVVTAQNVLNQKTGILITGFAAAALPFQGGYLCIQPPLRRSPPLSSGGSASGNDCTGAFAFQFTAALAGLYGMAAGDEMFVQFWYRDSASPSTTGLTNGLEIIWAP